MAPIAATTSPGGGPDWRNLFIGGFMQAAEAATLGMPLEVWKTRCGAHPNESAVQAFRGVLANGPASFWRGINAKLTEAWTKGAVLVFAKQGLLDVCESMGMQRKSALAGTIAGAGGGVAQTVVMSPLTFVVTYGMKKPDEFKKLGTFGVMRQAGFSGLYGSAAPMAMRQASNWALRQGINDLFIGQAKKMKGGDLSFNEKCVVGLAAGMTACINQPVEVLRIRIQAEHVMGNKAASTASVARMVYAETGALGFFAGIVPRFGLSAWQTLFMVTFSDMIADAVRNHDRSKKA